MFVFNGLRLKRQRMRFPPHSIQTPVTRTFFQVISAYQRSATFEKAYLTDLLQEMTDLGTAAHCVTIERGWKEIDTV